MAESPRLIAFHLPQFHPVEENDRWWGKGFTEWTNVAGTRPRFPGHEQPRLPADLGFYDLRLPEARAAQAELAREYGIGGFCYYHYWFHGRRLLERPVDGILASGEPDFPFCLCWANEPWSRRWDGNERDVLMPQAYSAEDDLAHARWLAKAFADPRYIRVEGRPLFLVYRAAHLADAAAAAGRWREEWRRLGVGEVLLARVESFGDELGAPPAALGFDAAVEFVPAWGYNGARRRPSWWRRRLTRLLGPHALDRDNIYRYEDLMAGALGAPEPSYERFRCVTPRWDNSARRERGALIYEGSTPEAYGQWLAEVLRRESSRPGGRRPVFVNAWNEWAEGNHLEPDLRWGRAYLEATREALREGEGAGP